MINLAMIMMMSNRKSLQDWNTPAFLKIKLKKTKRISPYSQNEIWDKEELLTIIKYETYKRNKAALALFWDLDARNHEITLFENPHRGESSSS